MIATIASLSVWPARGDVFSAASLGFAGPRPQTGSVRWGEGDCGPHRAALNRVGDDAPVLGERLDEQQTTSVLVVGGGRADVRALVEVRLARQNAVLTREEPLKMWAIVDEAVLRRQVGPHEVRERQLLRLAEAAEQPHVVLQVLPFSAGGHIGMLGPFVILEFPVRGDLDVVYAESLTSSLYLERDEDLAAYGRAYDLLRAAALDTGPSRDLIIRIAKGTE